MKAPPVLSAVAMATLARFVAADPQLVIPTGDAANVENDVLSAGPVGASYGGSFEDYPTKTRTSTTSQWSPPPGWPPRFSSHPPGKFPCPPPNTPPAGQPLVLSPGPTPPAKGPLDPPVRGPPVRGPPVRGPPVRGPPVRGPPDSPGTDEETESEAERKRREHAELPDREFYSLRPGTATTMAVDSIVTDAGDGADFVTVLLTSPPTTTTTTQLDPFPPDDWNRITTQADAVQTEAINKKKTKSTFNSHEDRMSTIYDPFPTHRRGPHILPWPIEDETVAKEATSGFVTSTRTS